MYVDDLIHSVGNVSSNKHLINIKYDSQKKNDKMDIYYLQMYDWYHLKNTSRKSICFQIKIYI